eukprot:7523904-Alexandrium_andersonii.AAC.1
MLLARIQHQAGRLFVHEHPAGATSWGRPSVMAVMGLEGVKLSGFNSLRFLCIAYCELNSWSPTRCVLTPRGGAWALAVPCELGNCVSELTASCVSVVQVGLRVRGMLQA